VAERADARDALRAQKVACTAVRPFLRLIGSVEAAQQADVADAASRRR
jgi:hypothetical protein